MDATIDCAICGETFETGKHEADETGVIYSGQMAGWKYDPESRSWLCLGCQ